LDESRAVLGEILDDDIAPSVSEKAVKGRSVFILGDSIADFGDATGPAT
jgi:hypothetical protein